MHTQPAYITIVDDDPDDRDFLCAGIQRCFPGVPVRTFGRGSELLTFLDTCNDRRLPLAMILDYRMPGLTGADVLRNTGKGTPYSTICKIVWSTSQLRKERDECLALGALQWIVKPATDGELDLAIRSLASMLLNVEKKPQFLP